MTNKYSRDDLVRGLVALVHELRDSTSRATVYIVGGAALRLAHFDRDDTRDIDARIIAKEIVKPAADRVASQLEFESDWLNDDVMAFWPSLAVNIEWITLYEDEYILIEVAPSELLLAMKLNAARPGLDTLDIARLVAITGITTFDEADAIIDRFYPGDAVTPKAQAILTKIWELGVELPEPVELPKLRPE